MVQPLVDGPPNVMGALIFFSYIIVALTITNIIVWDLWRLYQARSERIPKNPKREPSSSLALKCQGTLALISFVALSYHMLSFLIVSYIQWLEKQQKTSLRPILVHPSLFSPLIWQWATSSTLFQDFGEAICSKPASYWWTQKALVYSILWNWHMADIGGQPHPQALPFLLTSLGSCLQIPRLWPYFVLNQILPSSFSQGLFLAACELVPSQVFESKTKEKLTRKLYLAAMAITICYIQCLLAAPATVGSPKFFPILFATRALLLSPWFVILALRRDGSGRLMGKETLTFVVASLVLLEWWQPWRPKNTSQARDALNDNHAVSALGYDLLIGLSSLLMHCIVE